MKSLFYISVATLLTASLLTGCNTTGCTENQNSVPLAGFYSYSSGYAVAIDSLAISGEGAPNDSLLVGPSERASQVYLPLRATETSTTFVIKYMQKSLAQYGVEDRITFYYEAHPWFASEECGAMYHYRITRVSHTTQLLDSVGVADSLITNIERETIGLYFRTSEPDEPETPDTPETPETPEEPDVPDTPNTPETPEVPEEPEEPGENVGDTFYNISRSQAANYPLQEVARHE